MVEKKKTVKVKTHYKRGNDFLDKLNYKVAGLKSKKIESHTRKAPKKK